MPFHQDNAPAHTSSAPSAIWNAGFELLCCPPYSPYLASSDFYLLPKLKELMKGLKFDDNDVIHIASGGWLEDQDKEFLYNGMWALEAEKRWAKCISVEGDYVA